MSDEECTESTSECDGGDAESSVVDQMKKAAANPWTVIVMALLVGGGAGGASGLLGNHNNTEPRGDMVLRLELSDDQIKALRPPRIDDKNLATKIETAILHEKIETLREQVSELRGRRRPGRGQAPD
jgi:hypothetical protein